MRDMVFMTKEQRRRHKVTQGLTGLAQVSGRNNISWEEKLAYDQEYVKHITFLGDLKIIFKTIGNVLKKEDINTDGMATAEDFGDYLLRLVRWIRKPMTASSALPERSVKRVIKEGNE